MDSIIALLSSGVLMYRPNAWITSSYNSEDCSSTIIRLCGEQAANYLLITYEYIDYFPFLYTYVSAFEKTNICNVIDDVLTLLSPCPYTCLSNFKLKFGALILMVFILISSILTKFIKLLKGG